MEHCAHHLPLPIEYPPGIAGNHIAANNACDGLLTVGTSPGNGVAIPARGPAYAYCDASSRIPPKVV